MWADPLCRPFAAAEPIDAGYQNGGHYGGGEDVEDLVD